MHILRKILDYHKIILAVILLLPFNAHPMKRRTPLPNEESQNPLAQEKPQTKTNTSDNKSSNKKARIDDESDLGTLNDNSAETVIDEYLCQFELTPPTNQNLSDHPFLQPQFLEGLAKGKWIEDDFEQNFTPMKFLQLLDGPDGSDHLSQVRDQIKHIHLASREEDLVTDFVLSFLRQFPNLTKLSVTGSCRITDAGLKFLQGMPLTSLALPACKGITSKGLRFLRGMPLHYLSLEGTLDITPQGLQHLEGMPLKVLNLGSCKVTDGCLQAIENMQLEGLYISGPFTDKGLRALANMPLTDLSIERNDRITAEGLESLRKIPLNKLSLEGCANIADEALEYLPNDLIELNLDYCRKITDRGLQNLSKLQKLTALYLFGCKEITDAGLTHLPRSITRLVLGECWRITAEGLQNLPENITELDLRYCNAFSMRKLDIFKYLKKHHNLKKITMPNLAIIEGEELKNALTSSILITPGL